VALLYFLYCIIDWSGYVDQGEVAACCLNVKVCDGGGLSRDSSEREVEES
jgi:hypothetical protein